MLACRFGYLDPLLLGPFSLWSKPVPPTPTCTRRIQFCSGHRVMGHENKCAHLHGHNYVVELTAAASSLDGIGRVIDFSVLKSKIGGWIEANWDHGFVLYSGDRAALVAMEAFEAKETSLSPRDRPTFSQKVHTIPYNPTAENMALYLLEVVGPEVLAGTGVKLVKVVVHETENCKAEAKLSDTCI